MPSTSPFTTSSTISSAIPPVSRFRTSVVAFRCSFLLPFLLFVQVAIAPLAYAQNQLTNGDNPGVVEINAPDKYRQVMAISDVHGQFEHLTMLLRAAKVIDTESNWKAGRTLLVVCGDSIDKGPASLKVLHLWMHLMPKAEAAGGRLLVLLGNHEAEFLADPTAKKSVIFRGELIAAHIVPTEVAAGKDADGIGKFLRSLPLAAKVGTYLMAHAGWFPVQTSWSAFQTEAKSILQAGNYSNALLIGPHSILEEKEEVPAGATDPVKWYDDPRSVKSLEARLREHGFYGVVLGHQPKAFGYKGKIGGIDNLQIIKIDTGMAPDAENSLGEILCFKHPSDLKHDVAPNAERILADGSHATIEVKTTP